MMAPPKRAILYCRVSNDTETALRLLRDQEQKLRAHCGAERVEVVSVFRELAVGTELAGRFAIREALALIRDGQADLLLAVSPDRLSYDPADMTWLHDELARHGAALHFAV